MWCFESKPSKWKDLLDMNLRVGSILQDRYCATQIGFLELLNRNMFKSAFVSNANVKQPDLVPVANLWYKFSLGSSNQQ